MAKNDDYQDRDIGRVAAEIEAASQKSKRYRKMDFWRPYPKQQEFFNATLRHREVGLFAGTQLGKTESAAFMTAAHLSGLYSKGWKGHTFDHAIMAWAVGENLKMTRDVMQHKLCGAPGNTEDFDADVRRVKCDRLGPRPLRPLLVARHQGPFGRKSGRGCALAGSG